MPNLTLSLPPEIKHRMDAHPNVRWSSVVRSIIEQKLDSFEKAEQLAKDSQFTLADAKHFSEKINVEMGKHAEELLHASRRRR